MNHAQLVALGGRSAPAISRRWLESIGSCEFDAFGLPAVTQEWRVLAVDKAVDLIAEVTGQAVETLVLG